MAIWFSNYDDWKTSIPDEPESDCVCSECGEKLYEGFDFYDFGDGILCEDCARDWFDSHKGTVTEDMVNKGREYEYEEMP